MAGHSPTCSLFNYEKKLSTSSRGKLFNCTSILWALNHHKSFITFTLPSILNGVYQYSPTCFYTGDVSVGSAFSRTLEAWKKREKRKGVTLSYVWVAEAQMKRQEKYGGIGDLHYHLVVNRKLKHDNGKFADRETFEWLQENWNSQLLLKQQVNNSVHVDPIPNFANSIPAYLSKYLGKGKSRAIVSRQFQSTHDLSAYKPIQLTSPPDLDMIRESVYTTPTGFDVVTRYYNTTETLETFAHLMKDESNFSSTRGNGSSLTDHSRAMDRIKAKLAFA